MFHGRALPLGARHLTFSSQPWTLDRGAWACVDAAAPSPLELRVRDGGLRVIGQRINNYEVKSLLGEGGMGVVYLAEHPVIGRKVAVKVLHPMFATAADVVARFFNEAKAANASASRHRRRHRRGDACRTALPYLVMELLEGESLAARLEREGRRSPPAWTWPIRPARRWAPRTPPGSCTAISSPPTCS